MQSPAANQTAVACPWINTRVLEDGLRNGELSLSTAIGQFAAFVSEVLKIFWASAEEQVEANMQRKIKLEKMDKVIEDLNSRCQGMQQALLYKEEMYDSKCREVERYKVICEMSASAAVDEDRRSSQMASYYVGGPVKRKHVEDDNISVSNGSVSNMSENRFREQLAIIGGMNLSGPKVNPGPVPLGKLHRQVNPFVEDRNKRVKVSLFGQSNEVMSSSKNAVDKMKQIFTEKDHHRQVAGGNWTRMSSRRKKEWPF